MPYKFTAKEQDEETGLYYYGARYLDAKYSRWLSADPAVSDYIPMAPVNDEARKHNQNLPGMGGIFNHINCNLYAYGANNPVRYIDPDGETPVKPNTKIGQQAHTFFEDQLAIILLSKQAASHRTAYSDRSLKRIMNFLFKQMGVDTRNQAILAEQDPAVDELSAPQKRPDLAITNSIDNTITVYELKPDSCRTGYKNTKAKAQIAGYIADLSKNSSGYNVKVGTDIPSGFTLPYPEAGENATITFTADPTTPGLYYYTIDDGK